MKKLFIIGLLGACAANPIFHFNTPVRISTGFYGGCDGRVVNFQRRGIDEPLYLVKVSQCTGVEVVTGEVWIPGSQLEVK